MKLFVVCRSRFRKVIVLYSILFLTINLIDAPFQAHHFLCDNLTGLVLVGVTINIEKGRAQWIASTQAKNAIPYYEGTKEMAHSLYVGVPKLFNSSFESISERQFFPSVFFFASRKKCFHNGWYNSISRFKVNRDILS